MNNIKVTIEGDNKNAIDMYLMIAYECNDIPVNLTSLYRVVWGGFIISKIY